jgi:hypothetical protein
MTGRPVPYKDLLDAAKHAAGFIWPTPGATHITIRIEPSPSGHFAIFLHDFKDNPWWDGTAWQTDTTYLHEVYRWALEDAIRAVQPLLAAERAKAAENAAWRAERAQRAASLADAVDELLEPIREQVAS